MQFTFHLTNKCNLKCKYCFVDKSNGGQMNFETGKNAIDFAVSKSEKDVKVVFFGGEPLLCKELIYDIVEYSNTIKETKDVNFGFQIITNGILLDEEFMKYAKKEEISIAMSHDGIKEANDKNRLYNSGIGTHSTLEDRAKLLLKHFKSAPVMQVVSPNNVQYLYKSVEYLYSLGFRFIVTTLNYSGYWDKSSFSKLKREYKKLSNFYYEKTMEEENFNFSPFDSKIKSFIHWKECSECHLGKDQLSISVDGKIYPCTQFVDEKKYEVGSVYNGLNEEKLKEISSIKGKDKTPCNECDLKRRCMNKCACLNKQTTGKINEVSPNLCINERILIPIADRLAEKLFKKRSAIFIQKHYNEMYPVISMIEDIKD